MAYGPDPVIVTSSFLRLELYERTPWRPMQRAAWEAMKTVGLIEREATRCYPPTRRPREHPG